METKWSDILVSASEICYTRISSNKRRYATQTLAAQVHKMAVAPAQRPGRPSDWRQNGRVLAGWGAHSRHCTIAILELKSSENRHLWCITAKLKQSLEVLSFCWLLTTAVVSYCRLVLPLKVTDFSYLRINNRWRCPVLCSKSAKQTILYSTLLVTANFIFVLNLLCQRMRNRPAWLECNILVVAGLATNILRDLRHHPSPKFHRLWAVSYKRNLFWN